MSMTFQERVTVVVADRDLGVWDTFSGGQSTADGQKQRSGGMGESEAIGGLRERDNFTVTRRYKLERDHGLAKFLDAQVGTGRVVVVRTMLNGDRSPAGDPLTFTGVLENFEHPEHDSNSSDPKMVSLEVTADGPIS